MFIGAACGSSEMIPLCDLKMEKTTASFSAFLFKSMTVLDSCTFDFISDSKFAIRQELFFPLEWKERSSEMCFF